MAIDIQEIADYQARAEGLLAEQYRSRAEKLKSLLACFTAQGQQIESLLFSVQTGLRLATAVGEQLDVLGRVVGQDRESATDEEYRLRIAARIRANVSTGSAEDLYTVFLILLGDTATLAMQAYYPASFVMRVFFPVLTEELIPLYQRFFTDTKAAGVNGQFVYSLSSAATTFTLSSQQDTLETSALLGLADDAQTTGGHLAGVFR